MSSKINLEEEIICDYKVSKEMKKVWQVELNLLEKLLDVCKKHNIKIFVDGGTLLGVIRHKGFIPWDDDIDTIMFRKDYDKLCKVASKEFKKPYFFQNFDSDVEYYHGHSQLRMNNTTGIVLDEKNAKYHQGIFIDIFVLDEVPKYKIIRKFINIKFKFYHFWLLNFIEYKNENNFILRRLKHLNIIYNKMYQKKKIIYHLLNKDRIYKKLIKSCKRHQSDNVLNLTLFFEYRDRKIIQKKCFDKVIYKDFMYLKVPVPKDYDEILTIIYGDYMIPVKGTSSHGKLLFDTEKSYKNYL